MKNAANLLLVVLWIIVASKPNLNAQPIGFDSSTTQLDSVQLDSLKVSESIPPRYVGPYYDLSNIAFTSATIDSQKTTIIDLTAMTVDSSCITCIPTSKVKFNEVQVKMTVLLGDIYEEITIIPQWTKGGWGNEQKLQVMLDKEAFLSAGLPFTTLYANYDWKEMEVFVNLNFQDDNGNSEDKTFRVYQLPNIGAPGILESVNTEIKVDSVVRDISGMYLDISISVNQPTFNIDSFRVYRKEDGLLLPVAIQESRIISNSLQGPKIVRCKLHKEVSVGDFVTVKISGHSWPNPLSQKFQFEERVIEPRYVKPTYINWDKENTIDGGHKNFVGSQNVYGHGQLQGSNSIDMTKAEIGISILKLGESSPSFEYSPRVSSDGTFDVLFPGETLPNGSYEIIVNGSLGKIDMPEYKCTIEKWPYSAIATDINRTKDSTIVIVHLNKPMIKNCAMVNSPQLGKPVLSINDDGSELRFAFALNSVVSGVNRAYFHVVVCGDTVHTYSFPVKILGKDVENKVQKEIEVALKDPRSRGSVKKDPDAFAEKITDKVLQDFHDQSPEELEEVKKWIVRLVKSQISDWLKEKSGSGFWATHKTEIGSLLMSFLQVLVVV